MKSTLDFWYIVLPELVFKRKNAMKYTFLTLNKENLRL